MTHIITKQLAKSSPAQSNVIPFPCSRPAKVATKRLVTGNTVNLNELLSEGIDGVRVASIPNGYAVCDADKNIVWKIQLVA